MSSISLSVLYFKETFSKFAKKTFFKFCDKTLLRWSFMTVTRQVTTGLTESKIRLRFLGHVTSPRSGQTYL